MDPERWKRIDRILQQALSKPPAGRNAFLDEACAGDEDLRREVDSLIDHDRRAEDFIASTARAEKSAPDLVGSKLLHYRIVEKIGEGGMGIVYRALDTHLNRSVAVKVLPPGRMADPERRKRFMQAGKCRCRSVTGIVSMSAPLERFARIACGSVLPRCS